MTSLTRRTVLTSGAAAALASSIPTGAEAQAVVTRRSIGSLAATAPAVETYRRAVRMMKALPSSDPRNWTRQAQIHLNFCPHGNWFFLPWHRAYLLAFERICRQITSTPSFALPYWDWSANPQLPGVFATPTFMGNPNPLFDNTRSSQTVTIPASVAGPARIATILSETSFEVFASTRPTGQNNTNVSWQRRNGIQGPLEAGPHNQVHGRISGNMGNFMSPLDPIFWLHHCNIDRLWDRWNRMGRANTSNTLWRNFAFNGNFVTPSGASGTTPFNVAVSGLLNVNALGYQYVVPGMPLMAAAAPPVLAKTIDLAKPLSVARAENVPVAQINTPMEAKVRVTTPQSQTLQKLQPVAVLAARAAKPKQTPDRIVAIIRDVEPPKDGNTEVRVFVNCPYLSPDTPTEDRHYAGSFTFFGTGEHAQHSGNASFLIDITETVAKLRQAGLELKDEINVQLLPVPIPGVPTANEVKAGSVEVAFF